MPIGGGKSQPPPADDGEDKPVPRGAYNLDNLGDDAFGGPPPGGAKKGPPARLMNKAKAEEAKKPAAIAMDDMPIGGAKNTLPPPSENGDGEDKPIPRGAYNLDSLGDDAFGGPPPSSAPKKAPVAKPKPKADEDEVMKDETKPAPPKKAATAAPPSKPAASAKPAAGGAPKAAGGAGGGQDEDVGAGLSKEEAEQKVTESFPEEVIANFEDTRKWNEKVEGYKGIAQALQGGMNPGADLVEAIVKFVKMKMKDWKESNINIIKESIALFTVIAQHCPNVGKRSAFCIMPFLVDKLGDVKLVNQVHELLLSLGEQVTPKFIALQVVKHGSAAKAPNVIKESCNALLRATDEFGALHLPLKEMIDFAITAVNNSNP